MRHEPYFKIVRALVLSLALIFMGIGGITSAHNVGTPPSEAARINVNRCNGAILGYKAPYLYGVTATHCIHAPMDRILIFSDGGKTMAIGMETSVNGDITYIRWQGNKPEAVLDVAKTLPKPGDIVWIIANVNDTFVPVPAVWLGTPMTLGDIKAWAIYGMVSKGFSGSPVVNSAGDILGIISIGSFIDSKNQTSIIAPWAGVSVFEKVK